MIKNIPKYQVATAIAILFHCIGLTGILFFDRNFFILATPFNLLLSFSLLIWTQQAKGKAFFIFVVLTILAGYLSEVAGINTGLLFGDYAYGKPLGFQLLRVPVLIGVNWFIIIYCCGISIQTLLVKLVNKVAPDTKRAIFIKGLSIVLDGATLAVVFDSLMEPVAVKLGFWQWYGTGGIPLYNYICWFAISAMMLALFNVSKFDKDNIFAINLLLIQALFFLILRTLL